MHYYQHHIGDFIKATARLSDSQAMGYLRLLWMYYDSEKPLNHDVEVLAFQIGATIQDTELLLKSFFTLRETGWHQTRCDNEIQDYREFLDKKSNAGKASAQRRKNNSSTGVQQVFNGSSTDEQLTTNQQPLTTNHKPKREKATIVACPPDVGLQEWQDWLSLRKAKNAPVTETVLKSARKEAEKAGITLNAFLTIWCARGSQGLEASWLKSDEKQNQTETVYQRSMRLKMQEAVPSIAKQSPEPYQDASDFFRTIDMQTQKMIEVNK
jgi:uncharacterized protein YdaU (DUF1376 family)